MKPILSTGRPVFFVITLVLICILPDIVHATEPFAKVSTYTATFLRFPRGTRNIALGGGGAADPSTPFNAYYNPAVAFLTSGIHAVQGYNEWPADIDLQDYGVYTGRSYARGNGYRILYGGGVRYTHLQQETDVYSTIFLPEGTGQGLQKDYYLTMTAGAGISTRWIDAGLGFSAKPTHLTLADTKEWLWTYDMGMLARFKLPEAAGMRFIPSLGMSYLNFNESVDIGRYVAHLPDEIRVGGGLRIESSASKSFEEHLGVRGPVVALSGRYEYMDRKYAGGKDGDNYGVELTFLDAFSMRIGHSDYFIGYGGTTYGMGFGWWFPMVRVQFDVASFPTAPIFGDSRENSYGVSIIADL